MDECGFCGQTGGHKEGCPLTKIFSKEEPFIKTCSNCGSMMHESENCPRDRDTIKILKDYEFIPNNSEFIPKCVHCGRKHKSAQCPDAHKPFSKTEKPKYIFVESLEDPICGFCRKNHSTVNCPRLLSVEEPRMTIHETTLRPVPTTPQPEGIKKLNPYISILKEIKINTPEIKRCSCCRERGHTRKECPLLSKRDTTHIPLGSPLFFKEYLQNESFMPRARGVREDIIIPILKPTVQQKYDALQEEVTSTYMKRGQEVPPRVTKALDTLRIEISDLLE